MRQVAAEAGYTPGNLYVHFADKAALFAELCGRAAAFFAGSFEKAGRVADPVGRVEAIGRAYVAFAAAHPHAFRLMFMDATGPAASDTPADPGHPDPYAMLRDACHAAVELGRTHPEAPADAELLAQTCWAVVHGVAALEVVRHVHDDVKWRPAKRRRDAALSAATRGLFTFPDEELT